MLERERQRARHRAFRLGIVTTRDPATARVRVRFQDRDQMLSWPLPVVFPKTQNDKAYWLPDLGEMVVCLMDENDESGCVLGAIYSEADGVPVNSGDKWHVTFEDGATLEYDRAAHCLSVELPSNATATIEAAGSQIDIDPTRGITINSGVLVTIISATDIAFKTVEHNTTLDAIIDTYNSHTHGGVESGSDNSGTPNQEVS